MLPARGKVHPSRIGCLRECFYKSLALSEKWYPLSVLFKDHIRDARAAR
jgi:hypothetical protein